MECILHQRCISCWLQLTLSAPLLNPNLFILWKVKDVKSPPLLKRKNIFQTSNLDLDEAFYRKLFYGSDAGNFDFVMVEANGMDALAKMKTENIAVWFAWEFVHVNWKTIKKMEYSIHKSFSCLVCMKSSEKAELGFVQWYKVLEIRMLPMDQWDHVLECIWLWR